MGHNVSRFPREALKEARDDRIWPFLAEVTVRMELDSPIHRLYAYDANNNHVPFHFLLAGFKRGEEVIKGFPLLTQTGKMNCLSWSLPAGNPDVGGTCWMEGGSGGNQKTNYICRSCYAGRGNYIQYPVNQAAQAVRLKWVTETVDWVDGLIRAMSESFSDNLSFLGADANHFFRLHDSGDFFSAPYLAGWFEVIRAFPDVNFWCPTRMHWKPEFADWVDAAGGVPKNLALRPSGLHFNQPAPIVDGLTNGSTAHHEKFSGFPKRFPVGRKSTFARQETAGTVAPVKKKGKMIYPAMRPTEAGWHGGVLLQIKDQELWECPAYRNDAGSCLGAKDHGIVMGSPYGCRMCWLKKGMPVSYKGH